MVFCPEHAKQHQNLKFTPLSETTSIPAPFIWEPPPPGFQQIPLCSYIRIGKVKGSPRVKKYPAVAGGGGGMGTDWCPITIFIITCEYNAVEFLASDPPLCVV